MPNIVNQMVVRELQDEFKEAEGMGPRQLRRP